MPTLTQYLQTPQSFSLQQTLAQHPQFLQSFITYLTVPQNPLLCNERQCYLYPSKIADILSIGMAYRLLIVKKEGQKGGEYTFLKAFFQGIRREEAHSTLLGYCGKILCSLVRKTPQIYQFIKDNQNLLIDILKDDQKLSNLRQFLALFLVESTMQLYVFLKSMLIRNLIFRVVEDENAGTQVYRCINFFYKEIVKALEGACEEEKIELEEVAKLFQEQHFVTLFVLKMDSKYPQRSHYITEFMCMSSERSNQVAETLTLHIDTILDYLQQYEQTQQFMQSIRKDHLNILILLTQLSKTHHLPSSLTGQLLKRLLVYSNVHNNNSIIHNLVIQVILVCLTSEKQLLKQYNILDFYVKNQTKQKLGFMALRRRIFEIWIENDMDKDIQDEETRKIVRENYDKRKEMLDKSKYYNEFKMNNSSIANFSLTKIPQATLPQVPPSQTAAELPQPQNQLPITPQTQA